MGNNPDKDCQQIDPKVMIPGLIEERRKLITGFGGNDKVSKEILADGREAKHWAISLSGEPTLYKKLPELIRLLKERKGTETVFVVSNGQNPQMIKKMWKESIGKSEKESSLPTQLYISMVAPNEKLYKSITCNKEKDGWEKYLKTLAMLSLLPCRTVVRLTVIKKLNDSDETIKEFAEVLSVVKPDFIEIKSYMWLGYSRQRLTEENTPTHEYTKEFTTKLLAELPQFKFESEKETSRIVLLKNKESKFNTKIIDRD
jgi:tRNA wybutosine-synthesizing protein 1